MMATQLHSVATGNILPASVPLVCVDINPATVTRSPTVAPSQGRGIVTDVGLFLEQLALELVPDYRRWSARDHQCAHRSGPACGPSSAATRSGTMRCSAPTRVRPQGVAGGVEQPVTGGRDATTDDHDLGVEGSDEVGRADAQPVADRGEGPARDEVALLGRAR